MANTVSVLRAGDVSRVVKNNQCNFDQPTPHLVFFLKKIKHTGLTVFKACICVVCEHFVQGQSVCPYPFLEVHTIILLKVLC